MAAAITEAPTQQHAALLGQSPVVGNVSLLHVTACVLLLLLLALLLVQFKGQCLLHPYICLLWLSVLLCRFGA